MVTTTKYVWDPVFDCVTHELDENNAVKAVYHNEPQQYGGVLSQRRGNTSHYHHHDALGSTRFLTDSTGNVTDTYLNDAWGNSVASTGTTVNPFKWVGKYGYYTDNSTEQVYVRARMYQPTLARWSSMDPTGFADGVNKFSYGLNVPPLVLDASANSSVIYMPYAAGVKYGVWRRADLWHDFTYSEREGTAGKLKDVGSHLTLQFNVASTATDNPFWDYDYQGCCSCRDLSAIQIARTTGKTNDRPEWEKWHVDAGIPYRFATNTAPCVFPGMVNVHDEPGIPYPRWSDLDFRQDWETCIVCMDGHARNSSPGSSEWRVYCCIQWGHAFKTVRRGGRTDVSIYRYINSAVHGSVADRGMQTLEYNRDVRDFTLKNENIPCVPPTANFRSILERR
ncbi:MAG: RHS repeat-associated core domain-containing protein [Planctomycetia bacterium]